MTSRSRRLRTYIIIVAELLAPLNGDQGSPLLAPNFSIFFPWNKSCWLNKENIIFASDSLYCTSENFRLKKGDKYVTDDNSGWIFLLCFFRVYVSFHCSWFISSLSIVCSASFDFLVFWLWLVVQEIGKDKRWNTE